MRPSLEDHLGAGAVRSGVADRGIREEMSPVASAAADLFEAVRPRLTQALAECVGIRELEAVGLHSDVEVAASLDVSWVELRFDV
ncbi:2-phosphosulfolactate phosphatase [Brevibacterium sediminis]|uniref:Probable 2-phosphosulfolactate phosphatase n=1 Tax=Brevibacterium sediminis TaxID=1857024 RepID=A0A5C4X6R5_9MICO|nr:2-phosphosulfolactate phosphatase [Brevibacterium sediminis]